MASPEASLKAVLSTAKEQSVSPIEICHLLCSVHKSFPGLQPVLQELAHIGKEGWELSGPGLLLRARGSSSRKRASHLRLSVPFVRSLSAPDTAKRHGYVMLLVFVGKYRRLWYYLRVF